MALRFAAWRGTDDPDRLDAVSVDFGARSLRALGTSTTRDYVSAWRLLTGADFVTRSLSVRVTGANWFRELDLVRSGDGAWTAASGASGSEVGLPEPGLMPGLSVEDLTDARDCDIALCPLTNTMPIRRLA
jgi:hypothetical protein